MVSLENFDGKPLSYKRMTKILINFKKMCKVYVFTCPLWQDIVLFKTIM